MLTIFRVEDINGEGCYVGKEWTAGVIGRHRGCKLHPTPMEDPRIKREPEWNEISGFFTEDQAKRWFNEDELNTLEQMGFALCEVLVNRITAISDYQVLAIR